MVMGYYEITLISPKLMIKVKNSKTEEWPSGRAWLIAEELKETYRPKDMFSKTEEKTKVGQLKYKKGQNPDNFGTAIGGLKVEYRNQLNEDDKIATLVNAVGHFYGETIVNEMEKLEAAKGKEVTCGAIMKNKHAKCTGLLDMGRVL